MLSPDIKRKIKKYNKLQAEADGLRQEIESYLENDFLITENDSYFNNGQHQPFSMDGSCPIYEWGTRYFDAKKLDEITDFITAYQKDVGEAPELEEIDHHFDPNYED